MLDVVENGRRGFKGREGLFIHFILILLFVYYIVNIFSF